MADEEKGKKELRVFEELLSYAEKVHRCRVKVAFLDKPLEIYWMALTKEESSDFYDYDAADLEDTKQMVKRQLEINKKRAWAMIDKAQNTGEVPEENIIKKEEWEQLGDRYPETQIAIIGALMTAMGATVRVFPSGQLNLG